MSESPPEGKQLLPARNSQKRLAFDKSEQTTSLAGSKNWRTLKMSESPPEGKRLLPARKRYQQQIKLDEIGPEGQEKFSRAKILVVGAGGLGSPCLQYLAAAGVGTLGIIDGDFVEESNLNRQVLFSVNSIGENKAQAASRAIGEFNPELEIRAYPKFLNANDAINLFSVYDLIIDGTDNFGTKYLVNDASVLTNKPFISGAIFDFEGQVSFFNCKDGPTYRCLYPEPPLANEAPKCAENGVLGVVPGIVGLMMANEALKYILNLHTLLIGKLLLVNCLTVETKLISFARDLSVFENTKLQAQDEYDLLNACSQSFGCKEINSIELEKKLANNEELVLLDVRENWEREARNIGGFHIPLEELPKRYLDLPAGKDLIVYCESGIRSIEAIRFLQSTSAFKGLYNLKGGIKSY